MKLRRFKNGAFAPPSFWTQSAMKKRPDFSDRSLSTFNVESRLRINQAIELLSGRPDRHGKRLGWIGYIAPIVVAARQAGCLLEPPGARPIDRQGAARQRRAGEHQLRRCVML